MTLHGTNFVFAGIVHQQTNVISNFQTGQRLIPEIGQDNYLYDHVKD